MSAKIENRTVTFQPDDEARDLLRHVCGRLPEYKHLGGVKRAICAAIKAHWGPVVAEARAAYQERKEAECCSSAPTPTTPEAA